MKIQEYDVQGFVWWGRHLAEMLVSSDILSPTTSPFIVDWHDQWPSALQPKDPDKQLLRSIRSNYRAP